MAGQFLSLDFRTAGLYEDVYVNLTIYPYTTISEMKLEFKIRFILMLNVILAKNHIQFHFFHDQPRH